MNFYIKHFKGIGTEGGAIRNEAFYQHFRTRSDVKIIDFAATNIILRVINTLRFIIYFNFFRRNDYIFMHMGAIFVLFPTFLFHTNSARFIFLLLDRISRKHALHIEVNDLPFEQSKDLELPNFAFYKSFQNNLFKLTEVKFYFASYCMRSYTIKEYGLTTEKCQVVLNGSDKLKEFDQSAYSFLRDLDSNKLKFVYVGSLNKGRQIEDLIRVYEQSQHYLFLLGPGGDWIDKGLRDRNIYNVKYLGAFSDQIALQISSLCDMGVIPYDDSRFYYNMCYPTKVSFYLAAGLPILSTRLLETQQVLRNKEIAYFLPIDAWGEFISQIKREDLEILRQNVLFYRQQFYWSSLLEGLHF
jgi:glycosyltransferase involved in cell wall biosynthesis